MCTCSRGTLEKARLCSTRTRPQCQHTHTLCRPTVPSKQKNTCAHTNTHTLSHSHRIPYVFFPHAALLTLAYVCSKWSFVHCKRLADLCDRFIRGDASCCCFCVADTWGRTLTSDSPWRLCTPLAPSSDPAPAPLMWMTSLPVCTTCHRALLPCLARAPPSLSTRTLLVTSAGACVGSPRARYVSLHVGVSLARGRFLTTATVLPRNMFRVTLPDMLSPALDRLRVAPTPFP